MTDTPLLVVQDLRVSTATRRLLNGIGFSLSPGRTLAIIGESGAGKSMTALAAMGLLPAGVTVERGSELTFGGASLPLSDERRMRALRGRRIAIVFQDPMACLNPFMTIGAQIDEALRRLRISGRDARRRRAQALLAEVELPDPAAIARRYPHELSGGQQQRAMIAMAIAGEPELLIADEPTSALDASVEGEIINLLASLQARRGMAMLLITHDLSIASALAHDIAVMRSGEIVEMGPTAQVMSSPRHPYSVQLISARRKLATSGGRARAGTTDPVLTVNDASIDYAARKLFGRPFRAVHNVSLSLAAGRTLGVLGESGSGKSTLGAAIAGLNALSGGRMSVLGRTVLPGNCKAVGRECQLVFQNPYGALNPRLTIARLLAEPLSLRRVPAADHSALIASALAEVGLEVRHMSHYPHQLSGGQRQRVCIARALLCEPRLLICDEVVSALDMTVQVQVLELLKRLQERHGFAMIFISHDLEVVRWISDDIIVMQQGHIVDRFPGHELEKPARHELTKRLLAARSMRPAA